MLALALTLTLAAGAPAPIKLASPGLTYVDVDPKLADLFSDHFAQQLVLRGLTVITRNEIVQLLGMERQAQLLGCDNQSSCLAELAGGLGVDGLITGTVARLESGFLIDLKIVGAKDGRALALASGRAKNSDAMIEWLNETAEQMAAKLHAGAAPASAVAAPSQGLAADAPTSLRARSWLPLIGVVAFGAAGTGLLIHAHNLDSSLRAGTPVPDGKLDGAVADGKLTQTLGWVGIGVAGGCLAAAAAMYVFGEASPARVGTLISPEGGLVSVTVDWP